MGHRPCGWHTVRALERRSGAGTGFRRRRDVVPAEEPVSAAAGLAFVLLTLAFGAFSSAMFVWQWMTGSAGIAAASVLFLSILAVSSLAYVYIWRRVPRSPIAF